MKVALITDTHFGAKNDNVAFAEFQRRFYESTFFPICRREKIDAIVHLGDCFDRRRYTNFHTLALAKEMFFNPVYEMGVDLHMLLGNHDCYFKNNNDINSVGLTLGEYPIHLYKDIPEIVNFDGLDILMTPWICPEKYSECIRKIQKSKADFAFGHLPLNGSEMIPGFYCEDGISRDIFKNYERVFSGHFHQQQDDGQIRYLGSPYEITWSDYNSSKGFHILDTETRELEFFQNPNKLFKKIFYDDSKDMSNLDISEYEKAHVKLFVVQKTDFYTFDRFIDRCYSEGNFHELKIVEDFSDLDHENLTEEHFEEMEDTISLLQRYVDEIDSEGLNKNRLNNLLKTLYVEANEVE
jgi:DNA repair exonuclease SbcCD nuclease subunit